MILKINNVIIKTSICSELSLLDKIYEEACGYFSFDPDNGPLEPKTGLAKEDLPPGGSPDNLKMLSCYCGNQLIGYLSFYEGYPDNATVYIGFFYLSDTYKGKGVGTAIIKKFCSYFKDNGFTMIRVAVSLKNWPGLRFWTKNGFSNVTCISGAKLYSPDSYSCMELEKRLE